MKKVLFIILFLLTFKNFCSEVYGESKASKVKFLTQFLIDNYLHQLRLISKEETAIYVKNYLNQEEGSKTKNEIYKWLSAFHETDIKELADFFATVGRERLDKILNVIWGTNNMLSHIVYEKIKNDFKAKE